MSEPLETLPSIVEGPRPKPSLSPFHWTNLTLPVIKKPQLSVQLKANQADTLQTISQFNAKKAKPKRQSFHKPHPKSINKGEEMMIMTEQSRTKGGSRYRQGIKLDKAKQIVKVDHSKQVIKVDQPKQTIKIDRIKHKKIGEALNKTMEVIKHVEKQEKKSPKIKTGQTLSPGKKIRYLDQKSNMQNYLKMNLTRGGWKQARKSNKEAQLLWSNVDRPTDYHQVKQGQFYNHIRGSVHLTNKDQLHEELQAFSQQFYPVSFLIPKEYETFTAENNDLAVKAMLRKISEEVVTHFQGQKVGLHDLISYEVCLGQIFNSSILQTSNEDTGTLIKVCMYLQLLRVRNNLCSYFQNFKKYFKVNIKPKTNLFQPLIAKAVSYLDGKEEQMTQFDFAKADYRLLVLIMHYDHLFKTYDSSYNYPQQLWIVKPIASSRGAGISIVRSSSEFCSLENQNWQEFKNRKKYQNKIIQKYIPNPFILEGVESFSGRKFDIRQWVLVVSHRQKLAVFRYHTAYCRFAPQKFTLNKLNRDIHLTNYSIFKGEQEQSIPSVMMLESLFSCPKVDLRGKYVQQATTIVQETISNCKRLQYQEGCFQLFGFDFLVDSEGKLHLLEVNLNPACAHSRHPQLKQQTETMAQTMLALVTERKNSEKWIQVMGPSYCQSSEEIDFEEAIDVEVRPFYRKGLDDEHSLIALIRYKKMVIFRLAAIARKYWLRKLLELLPGTQLYQQKQQKDQKEVAKAEEAKDIQDNSESKGQIRFLQEKSTSKF